MSWETQPVFGAILGDYLGVQCEAADFLHYGYRGSISGDTFLLAAVSQTFCDVFEKGKRAITCDAPTDARFIETLRSNLKACHDKFPTRKYDAAFTAWCSSDLTAPCGGKETLVCRLISPCVSLSDDLEVCLHYARLITKCMTDEAEALPWTERLVTILFHLFYSKRKGYAFSLKAYIEENFPQDYPLHIEEIPDGYQYPATCGGTVCAAIACVLAGDHFDTVVDHIAKVNGERRAICTVAVSMAELLYGCPMSLYRYFHPRIPALLRVPFMMLGQAFVERGTV